MRFLSRRRDVGPDLDATPTQPAPARGRRRRLASLGVAATVLVTGGLVAVTATPALANITGAVVREGDFINVPAFGVADGAAICNPGEVVIGGGILVMSLDSSVRLSSSFANADFRWFVRVANPTPFFQEVHVRAMCARNVAGYFQSPLTAAVSLPPFSSGNTGSVNCPAGKVVIGGGFHADVPDFDRPNVKVGTDMPSTTNPAAWNFEMRNESGGFYAARGQVICTSQTNRGAPVSHFTSIGAGSTAFTFEECSSGVVVAAGYRTIGNFPSNIVTAQLPTQDSPPYWKNNFANPDSTTRSVTTYHACLPT